MDEVVEAIKEVVEAAEGKVTMKGACTGVLLVGEVHVEDRA